MELNDRLLRVCELETRAKVEIVADISSMIRDLEGLAADLAAHVETEERRTRIRDSGSALYSSSARANRQRRLKLLDSIANLTVRLEAAERERDRAIERLEQLRKNIEAA